MLQLLMCSFGLVILFLVAEYSTRRLRYFWKLRRNTHRWMPNFQTSALRLNEKLKAH
jgi:hypothetical protein